jgi:hypothetical protein
MPKSTVGIMAVAEITLPHQHLSIEQFHGLGPQRQGRAWRTTSLAVTLDWLESRAQSCSAVIHEGGNQHVKGQNGQLQMPWFD